MLAFVMLWAYFALSQFLIIWSGNLPEEISWYLPRTRNGWQWVGLALIVFHFAVPFAILLSRDVKRRPTLLATFACAVLVMRIVDVFWLVRPSLVPRLSVHWLDVAALVAVGGIWMWAFVRQLGTRALVPLHDPYLPEVE